MLITISVCLSQASGSRVNDLVLVCRQPVPGALPNDAVQTGHVYRGLFAVGGDQVQAVGGELPDLCNRLDVTALGDLEILKVQELARLSDVLRLLSQSFDLSFVEGVEDGYLESLVIVVQSKQCCMYGRMFNVEVYVW